MDAHLWCIAQAHGPCNPFYKKSPHRLSIHSLLTTSVGALFTILESKFLANYENVNIC